MTMTNLNARSPCNIRYTKKVPEHRRSWEKSHPVSATMAVIATACALSHRVLEDYVDQHVGPVNPPSHIFGI